LEQARKERGDMEVWLRVGKDKDVSAAIGGKVKAREAIAASKRDLVGLRRENYELRAARDGVVSLVLHNPGDVVSAGDPVVRVIAGSEQVVGFLPEIQLAGLTIGEKVSINRSTGRGSSVGGVVAAIGPEVQTLPGRISPIRGQPLRGRRVMVKLEVGHNFISGETVTICDTEPSWTHLTRQMSRFQGR
jgi:multidrug resistance efflux pump